MTIPQIIFDKVWWEGNFLIPADKGVRVELRQKLEGYVHLGIMTREVHRRARTELLARIAAIEAYDNIISKI